MRLEWLKTKRGIICICALVAACAICLGVVATYGGRDDDADILQNTEAVAERTNFLLLGIDRAASLCDVIMLVSVERPTGDVTVLQIPRDTYAAYTEKSYKKLNGTYNTLGGAEQTASFFEGAMGIEIDHYVCMGLDSLCDIVDALGGVDVDIPCDMRYSDPEQGLYISFKKGRTHLDGALAEKFVRYRVSYAQGDIGRLDAQKIFMAALIERLSEGVSPAVLMALCDAASGVETDIGVTELAKMALDVLSGGLGQVRMITLPGAEAVATQSGASYYVLSAPAVSELTAKFFGREREFDADAVFLNGRYATFKKIYAEYAEYEIYSAEDITQNRVDISTTR